MITFLVLFCFYSSNSYEHTLDFKLRSSVPQTLWVSAVSQAWGGMLETQVGVRQLNSLTGDEYTSVSVKIH